MKTEAGGVGAALPWESLGVDGVRDPNSHLSSLVGAIAANFSAFPLRTIHK